MYKRIAVLVALGLCVVIAFQVDSDLLRRLRARRVKETILVSAGDRRLGGFFDGLRPDPHWNAVTFLEAARGIRHCDANGSGGLLTRLASLFERTAHAQTNCGGGGCAGTWQSDASFQCAQGNCSNLVMTTNNGIDPCIGDHQDGTTSCDGGSGCSAPQCSTVTCQNTSCGGGGGGGCTENQKACNEDDDCCSGNCEEGYCQDIL